jgi:hypothetical protein
MANPFREGGSLNIPTQDAADEMKKFALRITMIFCFIRNMACHDQNGNRARHRWAT